MHKYINLIFLMAKKKWTKNYVLVLRSIEYPVE